MTSRAKIRALSALLVAGCGAAPWTVTLGAEGEPASVAQACLRHPSIKKTKVLNDRNILFTLDNKQTYNNVLPRQCPGMKRNAVLSYTYSSNELCAGSTFTLLQRVGTGSNTVAYTNPGTNEHIALPAPAFVATFVCQIGMFVPVSEDEVADIIAATEPPPSRRQRRRSERDMVQTESVEIPQPAEPAEPAAPDAAPR